MKKTTIFLVLLLCVAAGVFAAEQESDETIATDATTKKASSTPIADGINPKTGFPVISDKPFVIFNYGASFSQVTRIVYQSDFGRSNFVWQNYLVGVSCELQTVNMKPVNSIIRVAAYYPYLHTFNGMDQAAKQPILYGADIYAGPLFQTDMWKYVRINFSLGPHFFYELSDEYHHIELGGATLLGLELPVAKHWTILVNGVASLDYGNLGTNKVIQPYDIVWNYQLEAAFRFSKRNPNEFSYIRTNK